MFAARKALAPRWGIEPPVQTAYDGFARVGSMEGRGSRGGPDSAAAIVARMRELLGQLELLEAKPTSRYAQEAAAAAAGESPGGASDASAARGCEDGSLASQGGVGVSRKMDTAV